ncbi:MAG: peptide chain release factor 2, partial [Planctomycetota bacterium]
IRSYVLQPFTLVKDKRTRRSTGEAQRVLDGDLMPFMESYLRWRKYGKLEADSGPDEEDDA